MKRRLALLLLGAALVACDDGGEKQVIDPPDGRAIDDGGADDVGETPDVGEPDEDAAVDPDAEGLDPDVAQMADAAIDAAVIPACQNGEDDDGDGQTDYPADPGCADPSDEDETDPATAACADGEDNDEDGLTDLDDPGCADESDPSEANQCGAEQTFQDVSAVRQVLGTTEGRPAVLSACRNNMAPEAVFLFTLREPVENLHFDTAGTTFDTLLSVRRVCDDDSEEAEIACNDDFGGARTSAIDIPQPALGDYFVVLDGFLEEQGDFTLNIRAEVADGAPCPPKKAPSSVALARAASATPVSLRPAPTGRTTMATGSSTSPTSPAASRRKTPTRPTPTSCPSAVTAWTTTSTAISTSPTTGTATRPPTTARTLPRPAATASTTITTG